MKSIYRNNRPILLIEKIGSRQGGSCYYIYKYKITSTLPLSQESFTSLRKVGVLGYGQELIVKQVFIDNESLKFNDSKLPEKIDWKTKVAASAYDTIACVDIDDITGQITPAINPSNKQPYPDKQFPFYVYEAEDHVDSSD